VSSTNRRNTAAGLQTSTADDKPLYAVQTLSRPCKMHFNVLLSRQAMHATNHVYALPLCCAADAVLICPGNKTPTQ
jgi:hypothetical protein